MPDIERNPEIFRQWLNEYSTLGEIAKRHGISRERARQILLKQWRDERARMKLAAAAYRRAAGAILTLANDLEKLAIQSAALDPGDLTIGSAVDAVVLDLPMDEFELSPRARNCLNNIGAVRTGDLVHKTRAQLLRTPNFGRGSLREVEDLLAKMGLALETPPLEPDGSLAPARW